MLWYNTPNGYEKQTLQGNKMFEFTTDFDKQMFISLSGLIKSNDGMFKSPKQSSFIRKQATEHTAEDAQKYFGITSSKGEAIILCNGMNRWADYGSRGNIPQMFAFVVDDHGIVSKWKIPFNGNLRIGAAPAPERTTKVWERTVTPVTAPVTQTPVSTEPVSEHIGQIGDKIELEVEIISCKQFIGQSMSYWDTGVRYLTTMKSGDNVIKYWGFPKFKNAAENTGDPTGLKAKMKATVKSHDEYKGKFDTTVSRPSFTLI